MLFDNIRLYDSTGNPIIVKYVCAHCNKEMDMPFFVITGPLEELYYCEDCYAIGDFSKEENDESSN